MTETVTFDWGEGAFIPVAPGVAALSLPGRRTRGCCAKDGDFADRDFADVDFVPGDFAIADLFLCLFMIRFED
jgi:hypothetical protein